MAFKERITERDTMKILSITKDEGRVIELTSEEFREFAILAQALEGKTENETHWNFQVRNLQFEYSNVDFKGVFGAIKAFYEAKFRVNELQQLANHLQDFLDHDG